MKGEYRDFKHPHPSTTIFSKFHHHHQQTHPPPPSQHFAITSHQFQLSNTTEEADSRSRSPIKNDTTSAASDGGSIETVRRPRGRPPGSRNKPKPPVVITREPNPTMSSYFLELPPGTDIIDAVARYCRKRNMGLCVLSGSGGVSNVSLRPPSTATPGSATVTFHGRFDILSISATVLSPSSGTMAPFANGFTISLAGPQGQVLGGPVAGPLISAGPVYIIAASFNNPIYHRLSSKEDRLGAASDQSPPAALAAGGDNGSHHHLPPSMAVDSLPMYSSHVPSDVIWAPTPRQAPLHPSPY